MFRRCNLANNQSKNKIKLAVGYSLISLSLILFILSCIPNFAVSQFFIGIFGVAWYAYLVCTFLIGIANVLELKYMFKKRFTARLIVCIFSFIAVLHIIFSHSQLINNSGFAHFKDYLSYCYCAPNITVGGVVFGTITYFVKTVFGIVGAYSIFIMLFSIFGGIVLDNLIYGNAKIVKIPQNKVEDFEFYQPENEEAESKIETDYVNVNQGKIMPQKEEEFAEENSSHSRARDVLFSNREQDDYIGYTKPVQNQSFSVDQQKNKSARDILFSQREIPDITLANDEQRDRWMRNTQQEFDSSPGLEIDDIDDIFGNNTIDSSDNTDLYSRGFGSVSSFNDNSEDEVEQPRFDNISTPRFADRATSRMSSDRPSTRDSFNLNRPKMGENVTDVAKPFDMDFSLNEAPAKKPAKVQGKQIGIKSVRYNSIPLSIFKTYEEANADYSEEYRRKSSAIENVMHHFGIGAKVINVVRGPKVTRYELSLPDGVPVSKVLALDKNISMALAAKSEIRIEAPIPGKNAFGIELENDVSSTVGMRELLESPEFINCKDPLPIAIGKNINGQVIIKSLPKMIHLLVAGSSGSGKSIFIHTLLMSILYKYSPDDVRFIMIDPKRVEFTMYAQLPHLMLPDVVDEHDKALKVLNWTVSEMENRYKLLKSTQSQNIEQYNKLPEVTSGKEKKMTYLIIVVDELAELMGGTLKKDFEAAIQRITQLGRAAGIHMVLATQRPSVDVVSGTIKNNLPSRVAFALASAIDSKTVLDVGGAEKLLGKGDMLFAPQDMNVKIRLQAAFCDNEEIRNAINYIKENNETDFDEQLVEEIYADKKEDDAGEQGGTDALGNGGGSVETVDDLMKPVVKYARSIGKISSSMLQRKFRIGFNRAARIVFELEEMGFVGPQIGAKPRDFVMSDEQYVELFGEDDDDSIF